MGGAGGGSTKQQSKTQSFNFSDALNLANAWQQSQSQNTSDSASRSFVDPNQQPFHAEPLAAGHEPGEPRRRPCRPATRWWARRCPACRRP